MSLSYLLRGEDRKLACPLSASLLIFDDILCNVDEPVRWFLLKDLTRRNYESLNQRGYSEFVDSLDVEMERLRTS